MKCFPCDETIIRYEIETKKESQTGIFCLMKKYFITFSFLLVLLSANAWAKTSEKTLEVDWETLKMLSFDNKTKKNVIAPQLQKIIGKEIAIKGFMMPLDYDSKEIVEFLFMPYVPSCMHVPPPPANQLILVKMQKGNKIKPSFYPIELSGKIVIEASPELESSYKMEGLKFKELK